MSYEDDDVDLSDNNYVKVVRYRIVYTRRGYEAVLPLDKEGKQLERVVTIIKDTTADEIRGEKKMLFLKSMPTRIPAEWELHEKGKPKFKAPPGASILGTELTDLSQEDKDERVVVSLELLSRIRRPEKEYERDQAKALEGIQGVLKDHWFPE